MLKNWKKWTIIIFSSFLVMGIGEAFFITYSPEAKKGKQIEKAFQLSEAKSIKTEKEQLSDLSFELKDVKQQNNILVLQVEMMNNGKKNLTYNPLQFHLKDESGKVYHLTLSRAYQGKYLGIGVLHPHKKITGTLLYSVPKTSEKLILTYQNGAGDKVISKMILSNPEKESI